jgi:hypothetical protein
MGSGTESARGSERETVNTADEGTEEKESPADYDDYNQKRADDDLCGYDNHGDDYLYRSDDDYLYRSDDDDLNDYEDYYDEEAQRATPPPSLGIAYNGDSPNVHMAYCFSRYLVELLCVRPHFPFSGTFGCFNDRSAYYSYPKGQQNNNVDSRGNLILWAQGGAIEDAFQIRAEIPHNDSRVEDANFIFRVDPYACNKVITRTIPTARGREIDVTFVPLYSAIQANVIVKLDLVAGGGSGTGGGTVNYVYGEITAHHQLYDDKNVLLFFREQYNKAKVIHGKLPQLRTWAALPIYLDPLLIIKLSLHVSANPGRDGSTISFQGDLTFDRDQYEKSICDVHHGEVKVQISYE